MDLSVIIVTRNTCAQTCQAIASVYDSHDAFSKEIILVDNGSSDATEQLIPQKFPKIKYLRQEGNLGFAAANNLAARTAIGEFPLLLNSDARLQPEALTKAIEWMRAHRECGIIGGQLLDPDGSRQNSIANFPTLATELLNKSLLRRLFPKRFPGKEQELPEPLEVESVVGAFLLTRKELWDALGGLDERFFFFLEETDYCLQARRAGWKVVHLPQVKVWHGQGQTARQMPTAVRIEYWRSRYAYFQKHCPPWTRAILRVGLGLRLAVDWLTSIALTLLTLGQSVRWKRKLSTYSTLLAWHCLGCPERFGLPR